MKMNKDKIKKYHYWILAGLAPFLAILGVLLYATGVGAEVDKRSKEIETKSKEVTNAKAKGKRVLELLDEQKVKLTDKREELWKDNWNRQSVEFRLFDWPTDPDPQQRLKRLADKSQKFGTLLVNENDVFEVFKRPNVYEAAYNQIAKLIAPTTFAGGDWRAVFRHVSQWGDRTPKSEQIWLALEDYWVQRGLMLPIRDVNDTASKYVLVRKPDGGEPEPLKRTFRNPVWEIDLEVVADPETRRQVLKSRLKNHTDRLQFLGKSDELRLHIWTSDRPTAQPIPYRIQMDMVKAGDTIDVPINARIHGIPPGTEVEKIVRVEQLLDIRSVPVRQVMNVELGYKDSRMSNAALKPHKSWPEDEMALTAASPFGGPPGGMPFGGGPPGGMPFGGGPPGGMTFGRPGGPGAVGGSGFGAKGGTPESSLDFNKNRYLDSTDQVRRMPVSVVMVVDQLYMQDVLTAYANSPLRFQISQYHWKRFRGQLSSLESAASGSEFADSGFGMGSGRFRSGPTPSFGAPQFEGGFTPGFSRQSTVSADQTLGGLVELTIYGIISLYEKYEEPQSEGEPTGEPVTDQEASDRPATKPEEDAPTETKAAGETPTKPEETPPITTDTVPSPKSED